MINCLSRKWLLNGSIHKPFAALLTSYLLPQTVYVGQGYINIKNFHISFERC